MNKYLKKIYLVGHCIRDNGEKEEIFPSGVTPCTAQAIYNVIKLYKLKNTLEIGTGYGLSSIAMMDASQSYGGSHITIDAHQTSGFKDLGLYNIEKANTGKPYQFIQQDSQSALDRLLKSQKKFDFIFIDGSHDFPDILSDYQLGHSLLNSGGVLAFDDTYLKAVRKVIHKAHQSKDLEQVSTKSIFPHDPQFLSKRRKKRLFTLDTFFLPRYYLTGLNVYFLRKESDKIPE